jgi:hypothetical protein
MSALEELGEAIGRAVDENPYNALAVITGAFVSLVVAAVREKGHETDREIHIDGGLERDITIHSPKVGGAS